MTRIAIVGGGMAGLATAYFLRRDGPGPGSLEIVGLEARRRLGGSIATVREGGLLVETGADSFLATKPWGVELARELGLADRLQGVRPAARRVYVLRGGRLHPLPEGFVLGAPTRILPLAGSPLLSPVGKARAAMECVVPPRREAEDESLASFVRRRLGREVLERIAGPIVAGIHAGDPERLSAEATLPQLRALEREYGSVIRGLRKASRGRGGLEPGSLGPFATLRGGLGELVDALLLRTEGVAWETGALATRLERGLRGRFRIVGESRPPLEADAVVLATPAWASARIVEDVSPELAARLRTIPYASSAVITLAFRGLAGRLPLGSGCIVPPGEGTPLTACTWSSSKFDGRAPPSDVLLRGFLGDARCPTLLESPDETLVRIAQDFAREVLRVHDEPALTRVDRWPASHPQYEVSHGNRLAAIEEQASRIPGLFLTGSAYRGIGIPDCVRDARDTARSALEFVSRRDIEVEVMA